jgi:hypothetical protein
MLLPFSLLATQHPRRAEFEVDALVGVSFIANLHQEGQDGKLGGWDFEVINLTGHVCKLKLLELTLRNI